MYNYSSTGWIDVRDPFATPGLLTDLLSRETENEKYREDGNEEAVSSWGEVGGKTPTKQIFGLRTEFFIWLSRDL